jgi:hypothetical protein
MCFGDDGFHLKYTNSDLYIHSSYENCNDHLYNADVVEVFLGDGLKDGKHNYVEIEASPSGVLFVSNIYNPNLSTDGMVGTLIDCGESGVQVKSISQPANNQWSTEIIVPYELVLGSNYDPSKI